MLLTPDRPRFAEFYVALYAAIGGLAIVLVSAVAIAKRWSTWQQRVLAALCVAAAALTWLEPWYGSTLRYGNRDKQGLPFGVNNGGALGSFCLLSYILLRVRFGNLKGVHLALARLGAVIVLLVFQIAALHVLEEPWDLRPS